MSQAGLISSLFVLAALTLPMRRAAAEEPLKLLISVEQQNTAAPYPARVTLHLHNSGPETLWLYRHARSKLPTPRRPSDEDNNENETGAQTQTTGGSVIRVKIESASANPSNVATAAQATLFESAEFSKPKLVAVAPAGDYEEKASIHLAPAVSEVQAPMWGAYRISLQYSAQFSNGEEILHSLKVKLWQGEISSNTIEVQIQSAPADTRGEISGAVNTPQSVPIRDAIVSLTDKAGRLLDQTISDPEGRYFFSKLPAGFYWVTARRGNATDDTSVFRHVDLKPSDLSVTQELVIVPEEIWEPKKMFHKPALFHVVDNAGRPLDRVGLEVVFSNGDVVDNVKGETDTDGTVALDLIPGRNFVTLKRKGCPRQDERADVLAGGGVEGFEYTFGCQKK